MSWLRKLQNQGRQKKCKEEAEADEETAAKAEEEQESRFILITHEYNNLYSICFRMLRCT